MAKELKRLITTHVPGSKIESTRFRSIAFQNPTNKPADSSDEEDSEKNKHKKNKRPPLPEDTDDVETRAYRQHARTTNWREDHPPTSSSGANPSNAKTFQSPAEKRKVAFIKGEIHSQAATVHAYVVFAHPSPERSTNVAPILDPHEATRQAVTACDGVLFHERTLRVDFVAKSNDHGASSSSSSAQFDNRRTIFVGGLDFEAKEEDLRKFFNDLIAAERSADRAAKNSGSEDEDEGEDGGGNNSADSAEEDAAMEDTPTTNAKTGQSTNKEADSQWVTHVRVVRDKDTGLGKGIAYVEFKVRLTKPSKTIRSFLD